MINAPSASLPTRFTSVPAQHEALHDSPDPSMSQNVSHCPTGAEKNGAAEVVSDGPHELNERQLAAVELIVSGATDTAVAEALNVNRRTVYRWRVEDATFRRQLEARRAELYANDVDRLRSVLTHLRIAGEQYRLRSVEWEWKNLHAVNQ